MSEVCARDWSPIPFRFYGENGRRHYGPEQDGDLETVCVAMQYCEYDHEDQTGNSP